MKSHRMKLMVCLLAVSGGVCGADIWPNSQSARIAGHYPSDGSIVWVVDDDGSILYGARRLSLSYLNNEVSGWGYDYIQGHLTIPAVITGYIGDDYVEYQVKKMEAMSGANYYCYLSSVTVSEGVEAIYGSFNSCSSLSSAVLPSTMKEVGSWSFNDCTNLVSVNIPALLRNIGNNAFTKTRISSVALPDCCMNVGQQAFSFCTNLASLSLGKVKSLGNNAFSGCTALKYVKIPSSLESGDMVFNNCTGLQQVDFEEGLKNISYGMFYGCSGIKEIILPEGLTDISGSAFWHCNGAEKIVIPQSVTNVQSHAFNGCSPKDLTINAFWYSSLSYSSATNFTLLPGPASIDSVFYQSKSLQKITLPDTVKAIPQQAFKNCTSLQEVVVSDSVETVGNSAFAGCSSLKELPLLHSGCVTNWGTYVFSECSGIEKLTVPGDMKTISQGMFSSCTNLKEIAIAEGVETISPYAFYGDGAVEKIVLPSTVTNMNNYAGMDGKNLKVATFNELHPPKNIVNAFLMNFTGTAYYPPQYAAEWAAALASVGGVCKSWADASETDPGEVEVNGVSVPYGWLAKYGLTASAKPEVAAMAKTGKKDGAGKEMSVVDDYIAGTDPTNPDSRFMVRIDMSNGTPAIMYEPNLNANGVNRVYTIYGKADLHGDWFSPTNSTHRFFRVEVSMPLR